MEANFAAYLRHVLAMEGGFSMTRPTIAVPPIGASPRPRWSICDRGQKRRTVRAILFHFDGRVAAIEISEPKLFALPGKRKRDALEWYRKK